MASNPTSTKPQQTLILGAVALLLVLFGGWYFWPRTPVQIGADREVFTTVDALFTAVTAHDERLLRQSEQRIKSLQHAGKMPEKAAAYLDAVIAEARSGDWQHAAEDLYWFMKGQRRQK